MHIVKLHFDVVGLTLQTHFASFCTQSQPVLIPDIWGWANAGLHATTWGRQKMFADILWLIQRFNNKQEPSDDLVWFSHSRFIFYLFFLKWIDFQTGSDPMGMGWTWLDRTPLREEAQEQRRSWRRDRPSRPMAERCWKCPVPIAQSTPDIHCQYLGIWLTLFTSCQASPPVDMSCQVRGTSFVGKDSDSDSHRTQSPEVFVFVRERGQTCGSTRMKSSSTNCRNR